MLGFRSLTTSSLPVCRLLLNVQVTVSSELTSIALIALPSLHVALSCCQPVGAVSVSECGLLSVLTPITALVPLPFDVKTAVAPPSRKKLNCADVSFGVATLTILRKPSLGISTQSDGSEFGCSDGYEHVLMSFASVPPTSTS